MAVMAVPCAFFHCLREKYILHLFPFVHYISDDVAIICERTVVELVQPMNRPAIK